MAFSAKICLAGHVKMDGTCMVYLQVIIDGQRGTVPLGFYLSQKDFDKKSGRVKSSHPNASDFQDEMNNAITKANAIASRYRREGLLLDPETFKKEYVDPTPNMDVIKFMQSELELKRPVIAHNTYKNNMTVVNKLKAWRKSVPFNIVSREFIQLFRNELIKQGNGNQTIEKVLKIFKQYLMEAKKKGIAVRDIEIKIKTFKSKRNALTEAEVRRLDRYYKAEDTHWRHKKVLRYFLFSCYTGVRISDIKVLRWENIHDDLLQFIPTKTKYNDETVTVPLLTVDKQYLPPFTRDKDVIFDVYPDSKTNRLLKEIAVKCDIKKRVTYHTSRHTFGSMMAEAGDPIALQRMMGHSDIKTTMGYVHTNVQQLIEVKKARFGAAGADKTYTSTDGTDIESVRSTENVEIRPFPQLTNTL